MKKRALKALEYILLLPALLPLLYIDGFVYPYVAPKTFLFRALGVCVVALLSYLGFSRHELYFERVKQKVTWIPAALLLVAYITSFFGVDFYHSFWSTFERGDGLLTLTAAVIFFYGIVLCADVRFLTRLAKISVWVGGLAALYAILQWVQTTTGMNIPLIEEPRGRYGGTFGNAAFLASYLGMTFFLTLSIAREYRGKWLYLAYGSASLQLLAILIGATRGTILALLIAGSVAALYLAVKGEGRARFGARATLALLIILAGLFITFRTQLAHVPIAPVQRLASISLSEGTVSSRLFLFQNIGQEALERPIFGVGAEHIEVLFNTVYNPDTIEEEWFDRSHNAFLDYFVQFGILGLLLYLALIASALLTSLRVFKTDAGGLPAATHAAQAGGYLALLVLTYAIQNLFVFDTALTLWLLLAVFAASLLKADSSTYQGRSVKNRPTKNHYWLKFVAVGGALCILVLIIPVSLQPLRANRLLAKTYVYHVADVPLAITYLHGGLSLNTYADLEYGYQEYQMFTDHQVTMLSGESRLAAYRAALDILTANFEKYPYDGRTAVYLAHVLDLTPQGAKVDETLLNQVLDRAIEISPRRLQPWYIRANISLKKGDAAKTQAEKARYYNEAITVLNQYAQLQPESADPRYIIANLYLSMGDTTNARKWADAGEAVYKPRGETTKRAAKYSINAKEWGKAVRFLSDVALNQPGDYPTLYDLAKVKFLSGDRAGAEEIVARLRVESPGLIETDPAFLSAFNAQ